MIFAELFKDFHINEFELINETTAFVTKWNWDYQRAYSFQKQCVNYLKEHRQYKVFIFTSHPICFTNGRGLQKKQGKVLAGLQEFDESLIDKLPYPYHKIERGGGLTFHYPGQFIFYPIVNLTNKEFTLPSLMNWTLETLQSILATKTNKNIEIQLHEKAGLWSQGKKLASLGFALERFITFHGLALSVQAQPELFKCLLSLNPCGLNPEVYNYFHAINSELSIENINNEFQIALKSLLST